MSKQHPEQTPEQYLRNTLNRRELFMGMGAGASALAMMSMPDAMADGHTRPRVEMTKKEQKALEKANHKLVKNFCEDYSKLDAAVLDTYVADDIVYQITQGMPEVVGREAFFKHNDNMLKGLESTEWINKRQHTIGQVVINERVDEFYPFPGSSIPRMRFQVTGYFLIVDNKIKVWRDFSYPGSKQLIEPAPKA